MMHGNAGENKMPLQELLQIDVDSEGRVRRRRRSWSSCSSPQHLKAPGHLLGITSDDIADTLPMPPLPSSSAEGSSSRKPPLLNASLDEDEVDNISNVDIRRDFDSGYDSDTLRDIDDLLSPDSPQHQYRNGTNPLDKSPIGRRIVAQPQQDLDHSLQSHLDDDQDDEYEEEDEEDVLSARNRRRYEYGGKTEGNNRKIKDVRDTITDDQSEAEVKAEHGSCAGEQTPTRNREPKLDYSTDENVDILNLINNSRHQRSEKRRKVMSRILTPESVAKHLRTRSDTDVCSPAEKAVRRKSVNTKGWKPFGSRDHPPRLSTLRKVVSSSRSLAAAAEATQMARAAQKRQQEEEEEEELLDTNKHRQAEPQDHQTAAQPLSPTTTASKWSSLDILRWALVLGLWIVAIVNPHAIADISKRLTSGIQGESFSQPEPVVHYQPPPPPVERQDQQQRVIVGDVQDSQSASVEAPKDAKNHATTHGKPKPSKFVMPSEPARVEFASPIADGADVPQSSMTMRLRFVHLYPEQLALHRNPRLCMRVTNGGEDTMLGCMPVKEDTMEVSLKALKLGPTRVVAVLVSEAKKLGRASRQMNVVLADPVPEDPRLAAPITTTTTTTTTDEETQERCVTTCSRTCTLTYEV